MTKKTKDPEPTKSASSKKSVSKVAEKSVRKSTTTKKNTTKKASSTAKKSAPAKKIATKKDTTITKKTTKKSTKVSSTSKKSSATKSKKEVVEFKSEYYDLPNMYNKTVVKVLAQTPKMLFIYWEISEDDRRKFKKLYGENYFEITRPVLIVFNDTMHYSFEVSINDFANSWYLHIDDANCNYHVELGRRPYAEYYQNSSMNSNNNFSVDSTNNEINYSYIPYYMFITSSNKMTAPNNKVLFENNLSKIKFRNVKTGQTFEKDISQFYFITNFGIFTVHDLYKVLYPNENFEYENVFIGNPSSGLTTSGMFSSQFK